MVTTVSLNFSRRLESQTPEKDVGINEPLMLSNDVTTRKPGSDFDWLIVQTIDNIYSLFKQNTKSCNAKQRRHATPKNGEKQE